MSAFNAFLKQDYKPFIPAQSFGQARQHETDMVAKAREAFLNKGGKVRQLPSFSTKPLPLRRNSFKEPVFKTVKEMEDYRAMQAKKQAKKDAAKAEQLTMAKVVAERMIADLPEETVQAIIDYANERWAIRDIANFTRVRQSVIKDVCTAHDLTLPTTSVGAIRRPR